MKVINVAADHGSDVGRAVAAGVVYCGRPSVLGNPFVVGRDGTRAGVIEQYRRWLWGKLQARDAPVLSALRELGEDSVLGCWCVPLDCHCRVVEAAWRWLREEQARWKFVVRRDATDTAPAADLATFASRKEAWDWLDGQGIVPLDPRGAPRVSVLRVRA